MSNDLLDSVVQELIAELQSLEKAKVVLLGKNLASQGGAELAHRHLEPQARKRIDLACEHWIDAGKWPLMSPQDAALAWERLNEAQLGARGFHIAGLRATEANRRGLLRFLLVQYWELCGWYRFAARIPHLKPGED